MPEGRNHFYKKFQHAQGPDPEWEAFTWKSEEILTPAQIGRYKQALDPLSYQQEFEASFLNFEGRAYYAFDWNYHALERLEYDPRLPLIICFDFNVEPGIAVVCQEQAYKGLRREVAPTITAVIGEVWVERNSNTEIVCRRLIQDWGGHKGPVRVYGDASGGARGTAKVQGSDWDLISGKDGLLRRHFKSRLSEHVPAGNPAVKARVNAVNRRLLTADQKIHMLIDPARAPHVCDDLDGVTLLKGGSFEIDKKGGEAAGLTHLSDALGYYIEAVHGAHKGDVETIRA